MVLTHRARRFVLIDSMSFSGLALISRGNDVGGPQYLVSMRWFARPENIAHQLRHTPRPASWNAADHPDQVRLRAYLGDTEELLAGSKIDGPWALRLDVGAPTTRDLLVGVADLDNYALPLASRIKDSDLVSVWCTKQHDEDQRSFVRIEAAREVPAPSVEVLVVKTTASTSSEQYKEQIYAAVAGAAELPAGPVRLELSFVVGPIRNWPGLWKPTIDALDPLLGRTNPDRAWHPLDGRIVELGMHVTIDAALGYDVIIGISAAPSDGPAVSDPSRRVVGRVPVTAWGGVPSSIRAEIEQILVSHPRTRYAKVLRGMQLGLTDAEMAREALEAGQPINAESIAQVRKLVQLSVEDELVAASSDAAAQAGFYRELLNYRRSPELTQHINTKLAKLRELDPKILLTPLGHVHLGANDPSKPKKPGRVCPDCFIVHAGECP